jgi:hypothetical protein
MVVVGWAEAAMDHFLEQQYHPLGNTPRGCSRTDQIRMFLSEVDTAAGEEEIAPAVKDELMGELDNVVCEAENQAEPEGTHGISGGISITWDPAMQEKCLNWFN